MSLARSHRLVGATLALASITLTAATTRAQCQPRWEPIDPSTTTIEGQVYNVKTLSNGDLLAFGSFTSIAGVSTPSRIARWNGSGWAAVGSPLPTGSGIEYVLNAAELPNGDIVASGLFDIRVSSQVIARNIARWDGASWSSLGSTPLFFMDIYDVVIDGSGRPVVGAWAFNTVGPSGPLVSSVGAWNGANWVSIGSGLNDRVFDLHVAMNGDIIAAGPFTLSGSNSVARLARWNGVSWNSIGGGVAGWPRDVIELSNGDVVVGGSSLQPPFPEPALGRIGRWDGSSWHRFGLGLNNQVEALLELPNGHLVVGGLFTQAGGSPASRIARWDGQAWHPLGSGVDVSVGTSPFVAALTLLPNGDIVAAGDFTVAGGQTAPSIARWTSNPACYANCDCSTASPTLTPADFVCFLNRFRAGDLYANCDNSVGTPALTPADFVCFLNKFRAGCP